MVTICKGDKMSEVTESAYENYFVRNGWTKCNNGSADVVGVLGDESDDSWGDESDDSWDDEPSKPLSEMNRAELETYAKNNGVDLSGLTSNNQIRKAIKEKLEAAGE